MQRSGLKVGIFGGSFDPVHFGHLHLALCILEMHHLDKVFFCPAAQSPFKEKSKPRASAEERVEMIKRAIAPLSSFSLLESELKRPGPSYSIDTVRDLVAQAKAKGEKTTFYWMLGEDALEGLSRWKEVEELVRWAPPLIGSRSGSIPKVLPPFLAGPVAQGMTKIPMLDISSTWLRKRLADKLHCEFLIPEKVLTYIHEKKLYTQNFS